MTDLRELLLRIRDTLSQCHSAEQCLADITRLVATDLGSDVCSVYVRRAGEVLELFATHGLQPSAVHLTRLRFGEGLIGTVAASGRPLARADAQSAPDFVYRPETGEDRFKSMLGVPIVGRSRVLGVIAIQTVDHRHYTDRQIEALQTVALVLADMIARGDLVPPSELAQTEGIAVGPMRLEGISIAGGIGMGVAVGHDDRVIIRRFVADDIDEEHKRLSHAVADMHGALDAILKDGGGPDEQDYRDVLEAYRMIAADHGWLRKIGDAIDQGLTAEAAVRKVTNDIQARISQFSDAFLRDQISDFEDLANRLLRHLVGETAPSAPQPETQDIVLFARTMGPTELLNYDRHRLRGLVLEEGTTMAHVAVVARALDLPVVGQVRDALRRIDDGDPVVIDADHGQVFVRPGDDIRQAVATSMTARKARVAGYAAQRDVPAVTRDGHRIEVHVNAGLLVDMMSLTEFGADGVGLYRTEVPFLVRSALPDLDSQTALYQRILNYAGPMPVVFRTLDVGGDKVLPYWRTAREDNPAMGWRALRISLDRPAMLRQQARALIRAAAGRELAVMFPMITLVEEFRVAKSIVEEEATLEQAAGRATPTEIKVGAMLEVPSLLLQLPDLLAVADFVAIGSNDLLQFLFASDRSNSRMATRFDPLSPVVLTLIRDIVERCDSAGVPVSLCGEMAARPLEALALIGVGLRRLSVSPAKVGPLKTMIRTLHRDDLAHYLKVVCARSSASVRTSLMAYVRDHGVAQ